MAGSATKSETSLIAIGTDTGVSMRVLLGAVSVAVVILISVSAAWTANAVTMGKLETKLEALAVHMENREADTEKKQDSLTVEVRELRQSVDALRLQMQSVTAGEWSQRDDQRYMQRFAEQNDLILVPHYKGED